MSTNAFIEVEDSKLVILKYWDGDISSTLPFLKKFHNDFLNNRFPDPEYEVAQLLRSTVIESKEFGLDDSRYTGWGIYLKKDIDPSSVEYYYTLKKDKSITIKQY